MRRDTRTTRRRDRIMLSLIGIVLVAAATVALLVSFDIVDHIGVVDHDRAVLNATIDRHLAADPRWWQLGAAVTGIVLVAIGLWWLRRQLPAARHLHDTLITGVDDSTPGDTIVAGRALAAGFTADLCRHRDIVDARTDMVCDDTVVRTRITTTDDTDLAQLLTDVVQPAVARLVTVAGLPATPTTHIDIRLVEAHRSIH